MPDAKAPEERLRKLRREAPPKAEKPKATPKKKPAPKPQKGNAQARRNEAKVKATAETPEVAEAITHSYDLAHKLGINGTPAYVIGDELVYGAVGFAELNRKIEAMRTCGKTAC